jgi:hypothetical protein
MKLTKKRLKQIILEEKQKLDETFGRHMAGATDRFAGGFYDNLISQLAEIMKELYGADPMNFEGNVEQAKRMAMSRDEMQEAYTRTKKRK